MKCWYDLWLLVLMCAHDFQAAALRENSKSRQIFETSGQGISHEALED